MKKQLNKTEKLHYEYLIKVLSSAINQKTPPMPSKDINFEYIISIAESCGVEAIFANTVLNLEDKSKIIKEAAEMLSDYDKTDEARRLRDARLKQEYEEGVRLEAAKDEGIAEGIAQGREEGIAQGREEGIAQGREEGIALGEEKKKKEFISIMIQNGMKKEEIAKLLNLSLEDVEKYIG